MPDRDDLETALPALLDAFYSRVRADPLIGSLFEEAVEDWPQHLARIADFWSSVMLGTGRYKGNPVATHLRHAARLNASMFERWLELWRATSNEMLPPEQARTLQEKAARIAESLHLAILYPSSLQRTMIKPAS